MSWLIALPGLFLLLALVLFLAGGRHTGGGLFRQTLPQLLLLFLLSSAITLFGLWLRDFSYSPRILFFLWLLFWFLLVVMAVRAIMPGTTNSR